MTSPSHITRCSRTFTVAPGTVLIVECGTFRTRANKQSGCSGDFVQMTLGGSQIIKFCSRDLDGGGSINVQPQTFAYNVEWLFSSDGWGK